MLITEAFNRFNAKQANIQWSVSAYNPSDELVASLWDQFFKKRNEGTITYVDRVSRWTGPGNAEFIKNITRAHAENLVVRAIIAKSKKPEIIAAGGAANNLGNTFHPKTDWIGKVTLWDGDNFEIEFRKSAK